MQCSENDSQFKRFAVSDISDKSESNTNGLICSELVPRHASNIFYLRSIAASFRKINFFLHNLRMW